MRRIGETHPDGLLSFVLGPNTHSRKTDAVAEGRALWVRKLPFAALIISPPASAKAWPTVCAARRAIGRRVAEGWEWRSLPVGNAIGEVFTLENLLRVLPPSFRSFFFFFFAESNRSHYLASSWRPEPKKKKKNTTEVNILYSHAQKLWVGRSTNTI